MQYEPPPPSSHVPTVHATPATGSTSPPQQPAFNPGEKRRFPRFPSFPRKTGLSSLSFSSMSSSFHVAAAYGGEYGSAPPSYPPPGGHSEPQVVYVPVYIDGPAPGEHRMDETAQQPPAKDPEPPARKCDACIKCCTCASCSDEEHARCMRCAAVSAQCIAVIACLAGCIAMAAQ